MKLLIVDDEKYIREGLQAMLNWEDYGITTVVIASNGENGLREARKLHPDIILSDIRMPRMTGLEMLEKIRQTDPDCCGILLSAYSDIEYYRSAISLKVVEYLPKPVVKEDLEKTILKAIAQRNQLLSRQNMETEYRMGEFNDLTEEFMKPGRTEYIRQRMHDLHLSSILTGYPCVTCAILKFRNSEQRDRTVLMQFIKSVFLTKVREMKLRCIWKEHRNRYLVFFFFGQKPEISLLNCRNLSSLLTEAVGENDFGYLAWGHTMPDFHHSSESYQEAAWNIQKCFFETYGQVYLATEDINMTDMSNYTTMKERVLQAIENVEYKEITESEADLFRELKKNKNAYIEYVQNMYTAFFYSFNRQAELLHLTFTAGKQFVPGFLWQAGMKEFNLDELHQHYCMLVEEFFRIRESQNSESPTIMAVKQYIEENYGNSTLSLKDIADYVYLSTSRLCTVFKNETGTTVNQYLMDYRMEKARKYLATTPYSVTEIRRRTGYKDDSYFGRLFRKKYDISPVRYREQCSAKNHVHTAEA